MLLHLPRCLLSGDSAKDAELDHDSPPAARGRSSRTSKRRALPRTRVGGSGRQWASSAFVEKGSETQSGAGSSTPSASATSLARSSICGSAPPATHHQPRERGSAGRRPAAAVRGRGLTANQIAEREAQRLRSIAGMVGTTVNRRSAAQRQQRGEAKRRKTKQAGGQAGPGQAKREAIRRGDRRHVPQTITRARMSAG